MVELLVPITMFFVLIGGVQRALNNVQPWSFEFFPVIHQQLAEPSSQSLCIGLTQSLSIEARAGSPRPDGETGLAFVIEGEVSEHFTGHGQFGESVNYRLLLGPAGASFELCSTGPVPASGDPWKKM